MSIKKDDAIKASAQVLGPVAEVIIRDRATEFASDAEFAPFHQMLLADLERFMAKYKKLMPEATLDPKDLHDARGLVNVLRQTAYGKSGTTFGSGVVTATMQMAPVPPITVPSGVGIILVPPATPGKLTPDPNGTNSCFQRGCGLKFATFNEVMAHKVIEHGYRNSKYTLQWAESIAGGPMPLGTGPGLAPQQQHPNPNLVTQTNLWTPSLNLDLRGLNLAFGEASRFAAGEQHDARFYFIRLLKQSTKIKGKFVWTKFAHRFNWHYADPGDFVVRKLAGDTKEWVGTQAVKGVSNPAYTWQNTTVPKRHFENVYVGEHEKDLQEILANPHQARVNYGLWRQECGYCGRNLTDAESRLRGIGPDCWEQKYIPSLLRHKP